MCNPQHTIALTTVFRTSFKTLHRMIVRDVQSHRRRAARGDLRHSFGLISLSLNSSHFSSSVLLLKQVFIRYTYTLYRPYLSIRDMNRNQGSRACLSKLAILGFLFNNSDLCVPFQGTWCFAFYAVFNALQTQSCQSHRERDQTRYRGRCLRYCSRRGSSINQIVPYQRRTSPS